MDNQLIQPYISWQKFVVILATLAIVIFLSFLGISWQQTSDPYIQEVLSLEGNPTNGEAIFQINCSGCHIAPTSSSVGPNLSSVTKRKSRIEIIQQVVSGKTPPMPKFQPNPGEMADLLTYLENFS